MREKQRVYNAVVRLDLLLVLAIVALILQVFPLISAGLVWAVDMRNWPRAVWMVATIVGLLALLVVRFAPELYDQWCERRARLAIDRERLGKERALKEQREMFERLQRGRARRIY